jgi:hypothetical protein
VLSPETVLKAMAVLCQQMCTEDKYLQLDEGGCGLFKALNVRFHLVVVDESHEKHQSE